MCIKSHTKYNGYKDFRISIFFRDSIPGLEAYFSPGTQKQKLANIFDYKYIFEQNLSNYDEIREFC
jgi:hypothetical protein